MKVDEPYRTLPLNHGLNSSGKMGNTLRQYKAEMEEQLKNILSWWMEFSPDNVHGGFVGKVDHANKIYPEAPKGSVLNSRILWAFSSAYNQSGNEDYLKFAERAFDYFTTHFIDGEFGGVYWTVDFAGKPLSDKKQIYALAFAVYGLSEYYLASGNYTAKEKAIEVYNDILVYSHDEKFGGYIEALTRDWQDIADLRLSSKDENEKKSMNTHLHVLEAFTNLYRIWKDELLQQRLRELIRIFLDYIIDPNAHHVILFFDEAWNSKSDTISYGHDIEAAWLLQEAAEVLEDDSLLKTVKATSIKIAEAAADGLDMDGGLWHEYNAMQGQWLKEKHSWPQAEAMIGFFNAWQITGDEKFLNQSLNSWQFVKKYILDMQLGEWYWGVRDDYSPMLHEDKLGLWKCPYHNTRACVEIIQRINRTLN